MTIVDHISGDPDASKALLLYGDYTSQVARNIQALDFHLAERLDGQASFTFRQNPSDTAAEQAARFALAAGMQDAFWQAHTALYALDPSMPIQALKALSVDLGLNWDQLTRDMASNTITDRIARDKSAALDAGVGAAPQLFIDGARYDGAWDTLSILEAVERPFGVRLQDASQRFFHWAASAGLVLILATLAALVFVNVGYKSIYDAWRHIPLGFSFGSVDFSLPLEAWINDGLMAIFFLIVGIEIKREVLYGELSSISKAILPLIGAVGGICVPILIYLAFNARTPTSGGWGIPMATDIAFTLGLMALLGSRVPLPLKVFVGALAIADDLGAILVIAIFYGHGFHLGSLSTAVLVLGVMLFLNRSRVYSRTPYMFLAVLLWYFVHQSGLHATLAGVLAAVMIPSRDPAHPRGVAVQTAAIFETSGELSSDAMRRLQNAVDRLREPGYHLQHALETWSNFFILPLFAFFNTGIVLTSGAFSPNAPVSLGVILGLVIGKPLGICLFCWIAVRLGIASLSPEVSWRHMIGAGCLAGVGFTMSIFISTSAFDGDVLNGVKLSVLIGSVVAALLGITILMMTRRSFGRP